LEDKILKLRNILLIVVLLLVSLTLAAFAPNPVQTTQPPAAPVDISLLIPVLIGALGVPLVNQIKTLFKTTDPIQNLWITFGVSAALAVLALWLAGLILPMSTPQDYIKFFGVIFSTATLIYKSFPGQNSQPNPEAETKASNKPTPEGSSPAEQAQR
jgi:hypothetical protein